MPGQSQSNQLTLTGQVTGISPLRFTPAGVPVLELLITHESEVTEAGQPRRITLTMDVIAMGDLARMSGSLQLGGSVRIQGFLAPRRKDSPRFRLHAQLIQQI